MKKLVIVLLLSSMWSCKNDGAATLNNGKEILDIAEVIPPVKDEKVSLDKEFQQPQIDLVGLPTNQKFPKKEDWEQVDSFRITGVDLSGIAVAADNIFMVSDTSQRVIIKFDTNSGFAEEACSDMQVPYLNLRNSRLIIPQYDKDSIFVYRGIPNLFKFQLPYELNRPTSMDAFRIDDFIIVDRGNNRLVLNKQGQYTVVGTEGSGSEQFSNPSYVQVVGNSIFVSDTGNGRIQKLTSDAQFEKHFGEGKLSKPGAMATDGNLLFVCDEELEEIFTYNQEGQLLYRLSDKLIDPRDLFFLNGRLVIADANGVIRVFENKIYASS